MMDAARRESRSISRRVSYGWLRPPEGWRSLSSCALRRGFHSLRDAPARRGLPRPSFTSPRTTRSPSPPPPSRSAAERDRGALEGQEPSRAARLDRGERAPVRLLPVGHDPRGGLAAREQASSHGLGHRPVDDQHLPLRHVRPYSPGGSPRRGDPSGARCTRRACVSPRVAASAARSADAEGLGTAQLLQCPEGSLADPGRRRLFSRASAVTGCARVV